MIGSRIGVEKIGAAAVVSLSGRQTLRCAESIARALDNLSEAGDRFVVVDLSQVESMDSTIVGLFFARAKHLRDHGGELRICSVPPNLKESFALMGVGEFIRMFEDRAGALLAVSSEVQDRPPVSERRSGMDRRRIHVPIQWEDRRKGDRRRD